MAHEVPTARINNPDIPGDYIVIAESDFDPKTMTRFTGRVPGVDDPVDQDAAVDDTDDERVQTALDTTVANLGPWLAKQDDLEMLAELAAQETRKSAQELIRSRIKALKE